MAQGLQADTQKAALHFARLYRDCVESFCLIHQGKKDWDRAQRVLLVNVGIEQARLLAWSQIMGVCELGEYRDPRLNDPLLLEALQNIVKGMLDRLINVDHSIQMATYGLKPSKKASEVLETALDSTRLESFREQYMLLPNAVYKTWHKATHWTINDNAKFTSFIADTRDAVDHLISLVDVQKRVDDCVHQDIKALGWHPVFDRNRAALDGSKLRLIKDSCAQIYPQYSKAADLPIAYLNTQWSDSYMETIRAKYPVSTAYGTQEPHDATTGREQRHHMQISPRKQSFAGMLSKLRSHSWHKHPTTAELAEPPRSNSLAAPAVEKPDHALDPVRSRSDGAILNARSASSPVAFANPFEKHNTTIAIDGADERHATTA